MAWWQASAALNGVIALCYLAISWIVLKGLRDTRQMRSNSLALATAGIFFTCAVHHGSHSIHMILPSFGLGMQDGLAMRQAFGFSMTAWDLVGAGIAAYYLTLRRSYGTLLSTPQMFEDRVREQATKQLEVQAFTDSLTGLPNRAAFIRRLEGLKTSPDATRPGVLFLDLDRFKFVNDTLGHAVGDQLLVHVAERLSGALRDGEGEELYRLGGDEFTVLGINAYEGCDIAERLLGALAAPFVVQGQELYTTASIGTALAEVDDDLHDLLRRADTAMYHAKEGGGAAAMVFEPGMSDKGMRLALSNDLSRALERNEFYLDFQPIVELKTMRQVGTEALIRWDHPERGNVPPDEFIPFAEQTGQIIPIGRWVMQTACRGAALWQLGPDAPFVSVNVSPIELVRPDFIESLTDALESSGLPPEKLWIEVTEGSASKDFASLAATLQAITELGVRVSLDDFGTGWSSLSHLHTLPVSMIKIDQSFVAEAAGASGETLVSSVVALGKALGVVTVAEGVEAEEQLTRLRDLGCELAQGFLLARPSRAAIAARIGGTWPTATELPAQRHDSEPANDQAGV